MFVTVLPVITSPLVQTIDVSVLSNLSVNCSAKAKPSSSVRWIIPPALTDFYSPTNTYQISSGYNNRIIESSVSLGWNQNFPAESRQWSNGTLSCQSSNDFGTAQTSLYVNVQCRGFIKCWHNTVLIILSFINTYVGLYYRKTS